MTRDNYPARLAQAESAEDRKCQKCGRRSAMGKWWSQSHTPYTSHRECRWCKHTETVVFAPPEDEATSAASRPSRPVDPPPKPTGGFFA